MREYIASKRFHLGELDVYIEEGERVKWDGLKAVIKGEEKRVSSISAAIRGGQLQAAKFDSSGKAIEVAPVIEESPQEKAARLKAERLNKLRGSAGSGEFLEDVSSRQAMNETPSRFRKAKTEETKLYSDVDSRVVKTLNKSDLLPSELGGINVGARVVKTGEAPNKPVGKREIVQESEGVEVAKIKSHVDHTVEEGDKGFYEYMLDGQRKKLSIDKDQYTVPSKRPIVQQEDQNDGVEIKKLPKNVAEAPTGTDPLKNWSKMTATRKENYIKKATDSTILKQIIAKENGVVKRKAEERLEQLV